MRQQKNTSSCRVLCPTTPEYCKIKIFFFIQVFGVVRIQHPTGGIDEYVM